MTSATNETSQLCEPTDRYIPKLCRYFTAMLDPGNIFCLATHTLDFEIAHDEVVRKHNPLEGIGKMVQDGVVVYDTAGLSSDIEPHIFSKFQKIYFDLKLDTAHSPPFAVWLDDYGHVVRAQDAANLKRMLQSFNFIKDLVKILSNSPKITSLEITLEVEVGANSNAMEDIECEDEDSEEYETEKIENTVNKKATELFVDSGIMEPLKTISNIKSCDFKFGFECRDKGDEYKPTAKYLSILREFKDTIENNFKKATMVS